MTIMSWYSTGTIALTNGSLAVTGTGTAWAGQINQGSVHDLLIVQGQLLEIDSVGSDGLSLTLKTPYGGATIAGSAYSIVQMPTGAVSPDTSAAIIQLVQLLKNSTGTVLAGTFPDGAPIAPGMHFTSSPETGFSYVSEPVNGTTPPSTDNILISHAGIQSYRIMNGTLDRGLSVSGHEYMRENWGPAGRHDYTNRYNDGSVERLTSAGTATYLIRSTTDGGGQYAFGLSQNGNADDPIAWAFPLRLTMAQALFNTSVASDPASDALFADSIGLGPLGNGQLLWINANPANNNANITSNYSGSAGLRVAAGYSCQIHLDANSGAISLGTSDNAAAGTAAVRNPTLTAFPTGAVAIGNTSISGTGEVLTVISTAFNSPAPIPNSSLAVFASVVAGNATALVIRNCDLAPNGGSQAVLLVGAQSSNGRSISVAGSIGAPGADYAEWRMRAPGVSARAKGELVGYDSNGQVTNIWANACTFGLVSTAPSIIGADPDIATAVGPAPTPPAMPQPPAGSDGMPNSADPAFQAQMAQYRAAMAAYQTANATHQTAVDAYMARFELIAVSGHVPVDGSYAGAQAGDYVIAAADMASGTTGIIGQLVKRAAYTFADSANVVGRVRSILPDGRPELAVMQG